MPPPPGSAPPPLLITGAAGQVGRALMRLAGERRVPAVGLTRRNLDIADVEAVAEAFRAVRPRAVINAAAYTAVDRAEAEPELARAVNAEAPGYLATLCADHGIPLIHLSTDYVFDGLTTEPYREDDPVAPVNTYGLTKWEGEQAVRERLAEHVILRTSWVFAPEGSNFAATIARLARERERLEVVDDQWGSPTPAAAIASSVLDIVEQLGEGGGWGTYHYAGTPPISRYHFACAIVESLREEGAVACQEIVPVGSSVFPTPARRPAFSALDCSLITATFGIAAPEWRPFLGEVIAG